MNGESLSLIHISIVQNVNSRRTSVVLGEAEKVLYGKGFILDTLCGKTYAISPRSFYQINHAQTEVLYGLSLIHILPRTAAAARCWAWTTPHS